MGKRVIIADRQHAVRSALRLLLEQQAGLRVVGEAGNREALRALVVKQEPDLILLDWGLAPPGPRMWLKSLRARRPGLKVIALSGKGEARWEALASGVDAFVSKGDPPESLLGALG